MNPSKPTELHFIFVPIHLAIVGKKLFKFHFWIQKMITLNFKVQSDGFLFLNLVYVEV